jgi:Predicted spermidine synthase with an N-terminal membrane domain
VLDYATLYAVALLLFLLSGASSLAYEVAWVRLLSLAFGVSVYAVSAVLTAFMGGLALGSWLFGRIVSRFSGQEAHKALLCYALIQLGVGLFALFTPLIFQQLTQLYASIDQTGALSRSATTAVRFGLAFLVMLVPTLLMGGTLPAMGHLLARRDDTRGEVMGALYAANTFGAVLGTIAAGMLLIRLFGVNATIWIAAAIDLLIALLAFWLWRHELQLDFKVSRAQARQRAKAERSEESGRAKKRKRHHQLETDAPAQNQTTQQSGPLAAYTMQIVLFGFALSGFLSLAYQVVWTRLLAIFSVNGIFSFSIMLATFLIGLAVGGAIASRFVDRQQNRMALFGYLQLAIGTSSILMLFIFSRLRTLIERFTMPDSYSGVVRAEFFAASVTMLIPTLLIGAIFPVAVRIYGDQRDDVGARVGRLYAFNTFGSMLGSLLAGFVLIPQLGLQWSALSLSFVNIAIGALALLSALPLAKQFWGSVGGVVAAAALLVLLLPPGIYLGFRDDVTDQLVFYKEGVDATVAVFEVESPPLKISFVNGRNEVPTDPQSMRAFYVLGNLPPLLHPEARTALMVSFGNGIATGAMSQHPQLERIQAVELVAEQLEAAQLYTLENRDVLNNPKVQIALEDGRNYLLRSRERFDIITADATHPINSSSWALFTQEFYQLVRDHLADDGVFVQWLPFHDLAQDDYRSIIKTFQATFPHTTLFYTGGIHTILVATPQELNREQLLALQGRIDQLGLGDTLGSAEQLADDLLMDTRGVIDYSARAEIVRDDTAFFIPERDDNAIIESFAPFALTP